MWILKSLLAAALLAAAPAVVQAMHPATDLTLRWVAADGSLIAEKTLDTHALEALPQQTVKTGTPWTEGVQTFTGPSIGALAALGPGPVKEAKFTALNDYVGVVPAEDWTEHGAFLAVRLDGQVMDIRDKGPFWVLYPIDSDPKLLDTRRFHGRMVWQVKEVVFLVD